MDFQMSEREATDRIVRANILRGLAAGEAIYIDMQGAIATRIIRDLVAERAAQIVEGPYGDLVQLAA